MEYEGETGSRTLSAKAAVLAVPPSVVLRTVSNLDAGKREALAAVPFGSYIVVHFMCRKNFWADKIKGGYLNCSTTVFADILDSTRGQAGEGGIITCFIAGPEARRLIDAADSEIVSEVERDLERVFPGALREVTERFITRWRDGIPYFHPGYGQLIHKLQQPQGRLFFCGDYTEGAGIHDAVVSGLRSSREVARFRLERSLRYRKMKSFNGRTSRMREGTIPPNQLKKIASFITPARIQKLLSSLIRIPSPSGEEASILRFVEMYLGQYALNVKRQYVNQGRYNILVHGGERRGPACS